jgi:hypothetical protein
VKHISIKTVREISYMSLAFIILMYVERYIYTECLQGAGCNSIENAREMEIKSIRKAMITTVYI